MKIGDRALVGIGVISMIVFFVSLNGKGNARPNRRMYAISNKKMRLMNRPNNAPKSDLLFKESFENSNFMKNWYRADLASTYSATRSDSVASDGKYSLRVQLNRHDPFVQGSRRAELVSYPERSPNIERWYAFDIFLPSAYKLDSIPEILAQWQVQTTPAQKNMHINPPISLRVEYNKWRIWVYHDMPPVGNSDKYYGNQRFSLPTLEFNKWTKWIFHIKYSHGNDGIVQVWQNGLLLVDYKGPDFYDFGTAPYFKIGIYKPAWKPDEVLSPVTQRVVFYDDIKIGREDMNMAK